MADEKLKPCSRNDKGVVICHDCSRPIPEEACTKFTPPEEGLGVCNCHCECPACGAKCCCGYERLEPRPRGPRLR